MRSKVLHIVGNMNSGGTETMLLNLYKKIDREKIKFDFLCIEGKRSYYQEQIESLGGRIICIQNLKSIKEISDVIKKYGPYKVVHAHTLFNSGIAMYVANKNNVEIRIAHAHTTADNEEGVIRRIYIKIMRRLIINNSTNLLACSNMAGKYLFGEQLIKTDKYTLLPNLVNYEPIINIDISKVDRLKKEYDLENADIVIGHIGTFKKAKNQKFILNIVAKLKDMNKKVKLLLVGSGSMENELREITKALNIENEVIFTGIRDDIDTILNSIDVFVFPSIYEGLGLVLIEAQAAGLPCVVSEAIQSEADLNIGLLNYLNLSDEASVWANKIIEVCGKKQTDKQKILEAFDKTGYSSQKCISKLMSIYEID